MTFSTVVHYGAWDKTEDTIITEALTMSADWYGAYISRHTYDNRGFTPDVTARLAIARYEWLLENVRPLIFRYFSDDDLHLIALSLQRELSVPNDYPLARTIADDNEILWTNYQHSEHCALIDKLLWLTPLEDIALRDIIESYWQGTCPQGDELRDYIKRTRIEQEKTSP